MFMAWILLLITWCGRRLPLLRELQLCAHRQRSRQTEMDEKARPAPCPDSRPRLQGLQNNLQALLKPIPVGER